MKRQHLPLWKLLPLVLALPGCIPMVIAGGGATAAGAVAERRGFDNYLEDGWVANKIRANYIDSDKVKLANINVSVYNGTVLLTGAAASQEEIEEAIRIAKQTRGVTKVASELKVQHETIGELTNDTLISNMVKVRLLGSEEVRGIDIHVETTKGVVYLTGIAARVEERDIAVDIARKVDGVKEVVSYIEVDSRHKPVKPEAKPDAAKDSSQDGKPQQ